LFGFVKKARQIAYRSGRQGPSKLGESTHKSANGRCRSRPRYFFCSIGAPQHLSWPVPPFVTITCEEHLLQI
jgi:hypothetical protein